MRKSQPGLNLASIKGSLSRQFEVLPSRETLRRWYLEKVDPSTCVNRFEPTPSDQLSFFLGAWLGDGWADDSDGGKRLPLKVRSRDFAAEYAASATVILNKTAPYKVRELHEDDGVWYFVKVTSLLLHQFVQQPFRELATYILLKPRGFLRGFFTAEGNPSISLHTERDGGTSLTATLCVSNTDFEVLEFSRYLLESMGFHPTKITVGDRPGLNRLIRGLPVTTTRFEWQYRLARIEEISMFLSRVGFADLSKAGKAARAIELIGKYGSRVASIKWQHHYEKIRGVWVEKSVKAPLI